VGQVDRAAREFGLFARPGLLDQQRTV